MFNNVIVDVGGDAINCQDRTGIDQPPFWFVHNTIIRPGRDGIRMHATLALGSGFVNNLVVGAGESPETHFGDFDWTVDGNVLLDAVGEAGFVDPTAADYHLAAGSPAVDVGVAFDQADVSADYDGLQRDALPDVGAYERGGTEPPGGGVPGPSVVVALGGDAGVGDGGGCSCRSAGPPFSPGGVALLVLLAVWGRRRWRR